MSHLREKYRQIAEMVIFHHISEGPCLFSPTAVDDVADAACAAMQDGADVPRAIYRAFVAAEIYCPHEGIDRRAEFGIAA